MKPLEELLLGSRHLRQADLEFLRRLPNLRWLYIDRHNHVTEEGLRPLASLTTLEEVSLLGVPVTDTALAGLRGCRNLRRLDLLTHLVASTVDAEPLSPQMMTALPTLRSVAMNQLTPDDLLRLLQLPALARVSYFGTRPPEAAASPAGATAIEVYELYRRRGIELIRHD